MPRAALRESARVCVDLARSSAGRPPRRRADLRRASAPPWITAVRALSSSSLTPNQYTAVVTAAPWHTASHTDLSSSSRTIESSHMAQSQSHTHATHARTNRRPCKQAHEQMRHPPVSHSPPTIETPRVSNQIDSPPPASECAHASRCTKRTTRKKREPRRDAAGRRRECRRLPPTPLSALPRSPPPALSPQQGLGGRHPRKQPRHTAPARAHPPAPWPASR